MKDNDKNTIEIKEKESSIVSQEKSSLFSEEKNQQKTDFYGDDWQDRPRLNKDKYSVMAAQLNLAVPQRKGFVRQWVIDKERRIFDARGWKPVKGEDGNPMIQVMNHKTVEKPEYGTYMEIPERYFQENLQADDESRRDLLERRIQNKEIVDESGKALNTNNYYTPDAFGGNKIERNNK